VPFFLFDTFSEGSPAIIILPKGIFRMRGCKVVKQEERVGIYPTPMTEKRIKFTLVRISSGIDNLTTF